MSSTPTASSLEPNSPGQISGVPEAMRREKDGMSASSAERLGVLETPSTTAERKPAKVASLRWNFSWTFFGNGVYSACQWGMLMLLAKLGNPAMVGQYGLAIAVAAPVFALSSLQLRALLTTDVRERIHFGEYLGFRLLTTALSLLVIAGVAVGMHYGKAVGGAATKVPQPWETTWVILIVGVAQGLEIVSDLYYARMQFHEHMDRISKSMIFRGVLGLAAMGAAVYLTGSVLWGVIALTLARALVVVCYDMRKRTHVLPREVSDPKEIAQILAEAKDSLRPRWNSRVQVQLLSTSLTLGVIAMLVSLLPNIPRYFLVGSFGERALGIFTATASLVSAGNLIVNALGQSAFVRLAKHFAAGDVRGFNSLLLKLVGIAAVLGLGGIGVAVLFGRERLTLVYRPEYAEHTDVLIAMMVAGAMTYAAGLVGSAVTSARCFGRQIPLLMIAVASAAIASKILIPTHGLLGAAYAVIITSTVLCAGEVVLLGFVLKNAGQPAASES